MTGPGEQSHALAWRGGGSRNSAAALELSTWSQRKGSEGGFRPVGRGGLGEGHLPPGTDFNFQLPPSGVVSQGQERTGACELRTTL